MTISSETRKAGPFLGTGAVSEYPFEFKVFSAADLLVVVADENGADTELVLNSDFTVTLNADQDASPGGEITLTTPLPVDHVLVITSDMDATQPTDLTNQGGFYPEVVEDSLDRQTILIQQLREQVSRALKVSITSTDDATPDALLADINASVITAVDAAASAAADAAAAATFNPALYTLKAGDTITGNLQLSANAGYLTASANMSGHPSHTSALQLHTPILRNLTTNAGTLVGAVANGSGAIAGYYAKLDTAVSDRWGGLTVENGAIRIHSSASNNAVTAASINFTFKGVDLAGVANNGVINCYGIRCRQGTSGGTLSNAVNLFWTGTQLEVWVDTTRIGTVNITP